MKRLFSSLLAVVLVFALSINALAAIPTVYYNDGSSVLQYSLTNGTFGDAFENMIPGVTRTQQIALQNNGSKDTVRFFMSVQVLKTLINAAKDGAGYTVTLSNSTQTLFTSAPGNVGGTLIGGRDSNELGDLDDALYSSDRNGILVSTLEPGKSDVLTLSITPDATMSNAYQSGVGTLQFQFFAEKVVAGETIYIPGTTVTKVVSTGENGWIYAAAGVMLLSTLVLILTGKKKDRGEDKKAVKNS